MPIRAIEFVRKLRGGAQAHLMKAEDGHFYAVKFQNNPQGRRVLVNEWIAHAIFEQLRVASAKVMAIEVTADFLAAHPDISMRNHTGVYRPEAGWHFGSRLAGDPNRLGFYDYVPDQLLKEVVNVRDFLGALVIDRWLANADVRQAIFFRAKIKPWAPSVEVHAAKVGFVAMMIDHGYSFGGEHWRFDDAAGYGLYHRPVVYREVTSAASFEPWLGQVMHFPESVLEAARHSIPPQWVAGEDDVLDRLLHTLVQRRRKLPELLALSSSYHTKPFENWQG
ncbi:MAG: hypothetical protein K2X03_18385 [Bryobacteraceae bacterium]|nr:hypothetical protein [Bryobacteraceae bacterium]